MAFDHRASILLVDDDTGMQCALQESLKRCGYHVEVASSGEEGVHAFVSGDFRMVITDVKMKGMDGIHLLKEVKSIAPEVPVLMITAYGTIDNAIEAMRLGACDYLLKPFSLEALESAVERGLRKVSSIAGLATSEISVMAPGTGHGSEIRKKHGGGRSGAKGSGRALMTQDPQMVRLLKIAENVAASQATLLIHGESGTGKELLARMIHDRSPRRARPFVAINCAAIPDGLLESELFGHERGAFTGAVQKKTGKFMAADTGTLLLDEIGEMSLPLQAKILRVLQERVLEPVGGNEPVEVDIRIIATTHRHLRKEVEAGRFREDLYYRLNVFPITLPPLRERKGDIPLLVRHFLGQGSGPWRSQAASDGCPGISKEALDMLTAHEWRGNVRELENVTERARLLSEGGTILPEHLILEGTSRAQEVSVSDVPASSLKEMEKTLILKTLEESKGNRTHAAKALGIGLRTLRNKLREYRNIGA